MNALFCHDGPTYVDENKQYYACVLTDEMIERYFSFCTHFTLLNRVNHISLEQGKSFEKINHKQVDIISIPNLATLKGIIFNRKKAKKIIEGQVKKADCIIARLPGFAGTYALQYAIKYHKRYFVEMVGCPFDALWNHSLKGKLMAIPMFIVTKYFMRKSKNTIYVSNRFLQNRYPSSGNVLGCSDVEIHIEEGMPEKRKLKIENTNFKHAILGTMGTLNMRYKGFDTVIKCLSNLNKKGYQLQYVVMGAGDKTWLEHMIKKYHAEDFVTIHKPVAHSKVFDWIDQDIDIYIQPSRTEGMPRALIEAMSRACPSIGSDAGGIPELLEEKYIFHKGSYKELMKLLTALLSDKEQIQTLSEKCFQASEEFDYEKLRQKREKFYQKVIKDENE